jgi:ATP-binding cassette subfamily C protein CydC
MAIFVAVVAGASAVAEGTLTRVPLAVMTLTALAAFEAVTVLPAAALQLGAARASANRIAAVLEPRRPSPTPRIPRLAPPPPAATSASPAFPAPPGPAALTAPTASMFHRCC